MHYCYLFATHLIRNINITHNLAKSNLEIDFAKRYTQTMFIDICDGLRDVVNICKTMRLNPKTEYFILRFFFHITFLNG